jgi:5'-methylthioadenosine/S-adenosylhomocysteine nucleosidase
MIVLIGAVSSEIYAVKQHVNITSKVEILPLKIFYGTYQDVPIILVQSGIGITRATEATKYVLQSVKNKPKSIISFGFSGAIAPEINIGDVIVAQRIIDIDSSEIYNIPASLLQILTTIDTNKEELKFIYGDIATVDKPVMKKEIKHNIYSKFNVLAVEMESMGIARVCSRNNIPCCNLRVISDMADETFQFEFKKIRCKKDGSISWIKLTEYLITHPEKIIQAYNIWRNIRYAQHNLARVILPVIETIAYRM